MNRGIDLSSGGTLRTGGDVLLTGTGSSVASGKYNAGIYLNRALVEGTNLIIRGTGGGGSDNNDGFRMLGGGLRGTLDLEGRALGTTTGRLNVGVYLYGVDLGLALGSITGEGGGGVGLNHGIFMQGGVAFGGTTTGTAGAGIRSEAKAGTGFA